MKEGLQKHLKNISEQIQGLKKERNSLKEEFDHHQKMMREATESLNENLANVKDRTQRIM